MSNKVFCVNCAYFNSCRRATNRVSYDDNINEICNAPQNIRASYLSDGSDKYISSPSIINKYNNCQWFQGKSTSNDILGLIDFHNRDQKSHPYLLEKFNETTEKITEDTALVQSNLDDEVSRATIAEEALSGLIDNLSKKNSNLETKINEEVLRSTSSESVINSSISNLQVNIASLKQDITNNSNDIANEITRARSSESTLNSNIQAAITESKQYALDQDNSVKNYAISKASEERENAVGLSKQYTDEIKAILEREIDNKTRTLWHYKGKVNYRKDLDSLIQKTEGDVYTVLYRDDGTSYSSEFIWTNDGIWEELGSLIDLRDYYDKNEFETLINSAKENVINEAKELDKTFFNETVSTIINEKLNECKEYANEKKNEIETSVDQISETLNEHILNDTNAHDLDNRFNSTLITAENKANELVDESYNKAREETDSKVKDIKDNYLPLSGEKNVTGTVQFEKQIKVKDSSESIDTLVITSTSFIKKNADSSNDVVVSLPNTSGIIAKTSNVDDLRNDIISITDSHESRISTLESKIPSNITSTINDTSTSTDKDIPNNYAVKTALDNKANKLDVENELSKKAVALNTYTKTEVDQKLDVKSDLTYVTTELDKKAGKTTVESIQTNMATKDTTYTREYLDVAINEKATTQYVNNQLDLKANSADVYNRDDINTKLNSKADKTYVDNNFATITSISETYLTKDNANDEFDKKANISYVNDELSKKADAASTLEGYGITNAYTKTEIDGKIIGAYKVKASVETFEDLPSDGNTIGDTRNVRSGTYAGANFVWTEESGWDKLSETIDISGKQDTVTAVKHNENTAVGSVNKPVYVNENGYVSQVNVDETVIENSKSLITSGAVYTSSQNKINEIKSYIDVEVAKCSVKNDTYTKDEVNDLVNAKADTSYVNNNLATKANSSEVYSITTVDDIFLKKTDALVTYDTINNVDTKLASKANSSDVYTAVKVDELVSSKVDKTTLSNYLTSIQTKDEIDSIKTEIINHSDAQDIIVKNNCEQYADNKDTNVISECKSYTDNQIANIHNRHYNFKTITDSQEAPNEYNVLDFTSNNIDLSGKTGDVYIYLPVTNSSLVNKSREFLINISGRDTENCTVYISTRNEEAATFRDGGIIETIRNQKEEFSLKFQEYDTSKFLVDEVGIGDTINNKKVIIDQSQMILSDSDGTEWKFNIVDGQLKLIKVSDL